MKRIILLPFLAFLLLLTAANAQNCCKKRAGMQALALTTSFKDAHLTPEPFDYQQEKGLMIDFLTDSGKGQAYLVSGPATSNKVVIMFHEWWGLNDYIKQEADKLQFELGDVSVYAVDMYDGKIATTPDQASKYMSGLTMKRGRQIISGLLRQIGPGKRIVTLGWCMGGTWSFKGTVMAGKSSAGCVMYYGFPDTAKQDFHRLNSDVFYIRGTEDKFIKQTDVEDFANKVTASKHVFTLKNFKADHAFANPSNPKHNKQATGEAYALTLAFIKGKLNGVK